MTKKFMRWSVIFPLIIFAGLLISFYAHLGELNDVLPSPLIGKPVPAFKLSLLDKADKQFSEQLLPKKVYLLNVWASWCEACREEHAYLLKLSQMPGVPPIIGLDYKDKRAAALDWLEKRGNPFQYSLFDEKGTLGIDLGVYGVPETYVIDARGIVRYKWIGEVNNEVWQETLFPVIHKIWHPEDE